MSDPDNYQPQDDIPSITTSKTTQPINFGVHRKLTKIDSKIPQNTLMMSKSKIGLLNIEPGSMEFIWWFFVSSELPVFTACIGPLANMISIAALVDKWRINVDGVAINDSIPVITLNSLSLAMGCLANISLVLNFSERLHYKISQFISIICFIGGSIILTVALLIAHFQYFVHTDNENYSKSEGFWFGVITVILYAFCGISCLINFSGYLLGKYPPVFNLSFAERGLIAYTLLLAIWFLWGAAMFSNIMNDLSFGNAMYYCTISLLTIGLGDIVPESDVTKALSLFYSLTGVIILGLIIAMIRGVIVSLSTPIYFWNRVETQRKKLVRRLKKENRSVTFEESFELIRSIRRQVKKSRTQFSSFLTLVIFVTFWLIGALVFHYTEDWRYFDAVYFCFLCLITIGYGDYHPYSTAGRPVFIVWAIAAVPLMTALISNVGDTLYSLASSGISLKLLRILFSARPKRHHEEYIDMVDDVNDENEDDGGSSRSVDEILNESNKDVKQPVKTSDLIKKLKELLIEAKESPRKRYTFEEWGSIIELLEVQEDEFPDEMFWLSDSSPLSFPISEPNYMLYLLFNKLEKKVGKDAEILGGLS
ncbi:Outward-rectifier potassium channel TOK1 [Wickerhamomyces ciferrii]|uniref:Outward-rectifier potassium channel TOK1 n=1 Tax=Wickerhamomyces ciferrii (strain ATCC 14091 / BCRC 22168 / CBS 111 / JCM 3599 / NBRC 0793 / NRRL Y-1031 F-60-10) TaxID=1206466 RepID=K0KEP5_WICCF|nr:Outward-rectifier potassium channel TOK1 [Wickerhamomyces ciferrii]CCH40692.1 Outward-rectifier potassium channel TOK1 [Wickerhamomyces ciferrii]